MSLETGTDSLLLGVGVDVDGQEPNDFAALDSMSPAPAPFGAHAGNESDNASNRVGDGRGSGYSGVGESLFDRIRARTLEQQRATGDSTFSSEIAGESSSQHPTVGTPASNDASSSFDAAVSAAAGTNSSAAAPMTDNNETTYSFSASAGGEDFSQVHVPTYGVSRDDPYYAAANASNPHYQPSMQDRASQALAATGDAMRSLFSGAQSMMTSSADGQQRGYTNNFILREDSESGIPTGVMQPPIPPPPVSEGSYGAGASEHAYSMLNYGKTFAQDVAGFVMQLPPWGKGVLAVVVLMLFYFVFG
ncbi:hypothetical protein THAOC_16317 [Thalassiosira oceanica]|uniref:Uncharacterized protein n=1 Tax=Thalassiosira oceanica TaxID=159749 RepID=K0SCE9_THAOC|nr:hypothetical protein THAOC_16317 [Thalassiosira oceanica]|eukprot:EJK63045.1 hypothetical protein THAOC_16317 [Thalassiosira oceanica]